MSEIKPKRDPREWFDFWKEPALRRWLLSEYHSYLRLGPRELKTWQHAVSTEWGVDFEWHWLRLALRRIENAEDQTALERPRALIRRELSRPRRAAHRS